MFTIMNIIPAFSLISFEFEQYLLPNIMQNDKLTLHQIYSSPQQARYEQLTSKFQSLYKSKPDFIVRGPGRVNLIGQHIDYEGYGVLPFAIEKDCIIAAKITEDDTIEIAHVEELYPQSKMTNRDFENVKYDHPYLQYFYAGYMAGCREVHEGIPEDLKEKVLKRQFKGLKVLVAGNVPIAAGLSSSSSFCVCSALLSAHANGLTQHITKQKLIEQIIKYERLVGTAVGGMDQSISVLGIKQACLYIQFNPIRSEIVELPTGYKFIIMNSLEESKKLQTIGTRYNKRVCECKIAVRILATKLRVPQQIGRKWTILKEVQDYLGMNLENMSQLIDQFIHRKPYTQTDLDQELGEPLAEFLSDISASHIVIESNKEYRIWEAAKHVYQQANRVIKFIDVCRSKLQNDVKAQVLGRLMNQSQKSCKELYECSSELIDELTTLARQEGALGSRLTGAGWGGCTVSLVHQSKVQDFLKTIKNSFYSKERFTKTINELGIQNILFETVPAPGASLVQLS